MTTASEKRDRDRKRGELSRRLGRIAEKETSLRCTQAGLTVNKSEEDDNGWDLFVQFPFEHPDGPFPDFSPPQHSCLIQVKGTSSTKTTVRLSLPNALKLAKAPVPTFLLLANIRKNSVVTWRLLHCDAAFVERSLRTAAKLPRSRPVQRAAILLDLADLRPIPVRPKALRRALEGSIGTDPYAYVRTKNSWISNVGYGKHKKSVTLEFTAESMDAHLAELAEFAVGIRPRLMADTFDVFDHRFGMNRHEDSGKDVAVELPELPSGPPIELDFESATGNSTLIEGTSHVACAVFPFLPSHHNIIRIRTKYFDIVAYPARPSSDLATWRWSLTVDNRSLSLTDLQELSGTVNTLHRCFTGDGLVSLRAEGSTQHIQLMKPSPSTVAGYLKNLEVIEDFFFACRAFGLWSRRRRLRLEALRRQQGSLRILAAIAGHRAATLSAVFPPAAAPRGSKVGQKVAILVPLRVILPHATLVVITAVVGNIGEESSSPGKWSIACQAFESWAHGLSSDPDTLMLSRLFRAAKVSLRAKGLLPIRLKPLTTLEKGA